MDRRKPNDRDLFESIERILDYMIVNCDLETVECEYNKERNRLDGIQIALGSLNTEDSMRVDISIE